MSQHHTARPRGRSSRARALARLRPAAALGLVVLLLCVSSTPGPGAAAWGGALAADDKAAGAGGRASSGAKSIGAEFAPGEVLVRFRGAGDAPSAARDVAPSAAGGADASRLTLSTGRGREIAARVERFGGSELVEGLRLARVPDGDTLEAVAALNARADVLYAEPNYVWRAAAAPDDARYGEQWALRNTGQEGFNDYAGQTAPGTAGADIDAEPAWDLTTGSRDVVVAVIDGGVDINHPDLRDNVWTNPGEVPGNNLDDDGNGFVDDTNGWDFAHNDRTVFDAEEGDDHGTHVAGTIGARGNNGRGVAGVNWQVSLLPVKVLGPTGGRTSDIISGYNYVRALREQWLATGGARGANVRVTNNSYGGAGRSLSAESAIAALGGAGILFVAAAGNDSVDSDDFPHYPSSYDVPNVVSVAATDRFEQLAIFSNFGPRSVALGAPGRGILSTTPGDTYSFFSGTSMASPHAAGVAALVLARHPELSVGRLRAALLYGGDNVASPTLAGRTFSARRLNALGALRNSDDADATPPAVTDFAVAAQNGRAVSLRFRAGDDGAAGLASLCEFVFNAPGGAQYRLGSFVPAGPPGDAQSLTLNLPYKQAAGTLVLRAVDNAGNETTASLGVNVSTNAAQPYLLAEGAAAALSTGGTPLGLTGDDRYRRDFPLGFTFPFFGQPANAVTISTNGALYFSPPRIRQTREDADDVPSSSDELNLQKMIAGMWDDLDLRTCFRADADVYVSAPAPDRVIFRWQGVRFTQATCPTAPSGANQINFEIELRADGTIITRYGGGNAALNPVVGISGGQSDAFTGAPPDAYVIGSHTSETAPLSLTNAPTIIFAPVRAAPNVPPSLSLTAPAGGASFNSPGAVVLLAEAADADGRVSRVDFFADDILIGTATAPGVGPNGYRMNWEVAVAGPVRLKAVATDDAGASTTSNVVTINLVHTNRIEGSDFFVRQHYADFLSREADAPGLAFWTNNIEVCGFSLPCRQGKRIDTSAAFFLSIEFQQTGYLVYRFYKAAFPPSPTRPRGLPRLAEFLPDTRRIGQGVVVGEGDWQARLESNRAAFAGEFVARPEFLALYPATLSAAQFVDALNQNAGGPLSPAERDALAAELAAGVRTRAQVLRAVAEDADFNVREKNRAFVLMQYFGYLRRNPDDAPDADFSGYDFWLRKLDEFGGDFRRAEMVKSFIVSGEYRGRFGP